MKKLIPIVSLVLLAGCANKDMTDLQTYVQDVKARPPVPLEPIPQIKQAETFLYIPGGRRNPFMPAEEGGGFVERINGTVGLSPDFDRRKEELENYSLDTLKMVGTLKREENYWALVQTSDGTIHRVKPGNHLGRNYGRILDISEEQIALRELVQDGGGGYIERQASIALR